MQRLMKRTISIVIASVAVAMALVSCTKENISNKEVEKGINADGTRTLTVSFATKATKTYLLEDGITPVWKEGDQISLNGIPYDVPESAWGQTEFTLTTTETGAITAVYPATAYQSTDPFFKVSDEQDGSFGCANICVAQAAAGTNTLTFYNKTAVFAVAVPSGTKKLTVTSLGKINTTTGQRGKTAADTVAISTTKTGSASNVIIVEKEDQSAFGDTVYVAVAVDEETGVLLADLNFDTGSAQGGVSPNYIKSKGQEPMTYKAAAGTIYTPVLHEYVELTIPVMTWDGENYQYIDTGSKTTLRWATTNVGASSPTEYGLYFAWGETTGHSFTGTPEDAFLENAFVFGINNLGFSWSNAPFNNGQEDFDETYFSTVQNEKCPDGVLASSYDAARQNWGSTWRMPTKEEFAGLASLDPEGQGWDDTNKGNRLTDANGNSIFFPAAGSGDGADLSDAGAYGYSWSSSLYTVYPYEAFYLDFCNDGIYAGSFDCHSGCSVRPLSE